MKTSELNGERPFPYQPDWSRWKHFKNGCEHQGFWNEVWWQLARMWDGILTWRMTRRLLGKGPVRVSGEALELLKKGEGKYFNATPKE